MKAAKIALSALALVCASALTVPGFAQDMGFMTVTPKQLKWGDSPALPGAKVALIEGPMDKANPFIMRIRLPAKYKIAPHFHSGVEHVTVISGTFSIGHGEKFDAKKTTAVGPGGVAVMQPNTPHFVRTTKETVIQVHGVGPWTLTFVNPADDPRKK